MSNVVDPICGMTVSPDAAAGEFEQKGITHYFCSKGCLEKFKADPHRPLMPTLSGGEAKVALEPLTVSLESDEDDPELRDMTRRFWISLALTMPVFLLETVGMFLPLTAVVRPGVGSGIQFVFATIVVLWGGFPFFRRALAS